MPSTPRTPPKPPEPKLPHERDESTESQQGSDDPVAQQAHDDVARGLVDTSRAEETEATYDRELRSTPDGAAGREKPRTRRP